MTTPVETPTRSEPLAWRREWWTLLLLFAVVICAYFLRPAAMSLRGEEPRRAQVAVEMIDSGDWIMPREQGDPFMSRPPLQNWLIAFTFLATGERGAFEVRFPSLLATFLMVFIIYGYGRTFLTPIGALAAAAAFATFGEVLQECRSAETEALFTLFVSGSIMIWHWGMVRGWPEVVAWSLGYGLMALGMLAKSLQAPFYFLVPVFLYLILTRQWRRLFSLSHLGGMIAGALVLAAWTIPFASQLGVEGVRNIWMNDVRTRIFEWQGFLIHFSRFPLELIGCTLPWSPLLFVYLRRDLRESIGAARPQLLLMAVVWTVGVPTCWLPPNAMTRYLLPLYPCLAMLLGFVIQRCSEAEYDSALGKIWRLHLIGCAAVMLVAGIALPAAKLFESHRVIGFWVEPPLVAALFCAICIALAWLTQRAAFNGRAVVAVTLIAGFMAFLFTGPICNSRVRRGNDVGAAIAELRSELPPDAELVSVGHIHSELPFFFRKPVKTFPATAIQKGSYFCFNTHGQDRPPLPFAWQEVKIISVDRNKTETPESVLVIGRRN